MIRIWRTSVGFGIAGLMTGLLLLTPCATAGGPPVAEVPPEEIGRASCRERV